MLVRKYRLPSSVLQNNSRSVRNAMFLMRFQKNNLSYNRYGFVVAKTVDKRAVVRNRVKRMFRSCIEKKWIDRIQGHDVLFVLRPAIQNCTRQDVAKQIDIEMEKLQ